MRDLLQRLLDAPGPSGFEESAARAWRQEAGKFAEKTWSDVHGNSFAAINDGGRPRVMLAGHIDEIGLMVHYIDDHGYLFVQGVGGWDPQVLVGQRVEIMTAHGAVVGVVGRQAIHLIPREDRDKGSKLKNLWIDIGADSRDEAAERVEIGDVAVIRSDTVELEHGRIAARSIDNRIGALVVLEALRRASGKGATAHIIAVATAQEEVGYTSGGGARSSSFELDPDVAIVIDVTHATDHPSVDKKEHGDVRLGAGPVVSRGAVANPVLVRRLRDAAERAEIGIQLQASPSTSGTDADNIYTSRAGVATAVVSVPNRYMHSPNQVVAISDVDDTVELIATLLAGLSDGDSFLRE
jgi:putative aminopeptidase FrvX